MAAMTSTTTAANGVANTHPALGKAAGQAAGVYLSPHAIAVLIVVLVVLGLVYRVSLVFRTGRCRCCRHD